MMNIPTSLYIHIPFCEKRCSYCDFNTYAGFNHLIPTYVESIKQEIKIYGEVLGNDFPIKTIFFGGGTPSLIPSNLFDSIFKTIFDSFNALQPKEISLEANPGTVDFKYLYELRNIGFNRISFGLQSDQKKYLELLGRIHNHNESVLAIDAARKAKFENINADLIYGLPDQTMEEWENTLKTILALNLEHISLYALGVEENTPLKEWIDAGIINSPDDDLAASMYEFALHYLETNNYGAYEISNFTRNDEKRDLRCSHNLQYWRNQPYIGIGAGAHGFIKNKRTENIKTIPAYIKSFQKSENPPLFLSPAIEKIIDIDTFTEMQETMMVGLRLLNEGVSIPTFYERFQKSPLDVFGKEIQYLLKNQLIKIDDQEIITLTKEKIMVSNQVFQEFVN